MESLRGIGRMARESGLTVSALRFYDGTGVFGPAHVDPHSGYRFYAPDQVVVARLVATLRRVGMALPGIREVLAVRQDRDAVDALLAAHLQRLEQGLLDARRELSAIATLLDPEENPMTRTTVTVRGADLAASIRAVRFAVGAEPAVLGGILFDVGPEVITLVATDRYRLAVATVPVVALDGPAVAAVLPAAAVDEITAAGGDPVELRIEGAVFHAGDTTASLLSDPFPDYRRVLSTAPARRRVDVGAAELREAVAAGGLRTMRRAQDGTDIGVTALGIAADGVLVVGPDVVGGVGVDAEFLLEAAGGSGQLVLELDGPIAPLAIRPREPAGAFSLLMPVKL